MHLQRILKGFTIRYCLRQAEPQILLSRKRWLVHRNRCLWTKFQNLCSKTDNVLHEPLEHAFHEMTALDHAGDFCNRVYLSLSLSILLGSLVRSFKPVLNLQKSSCTPLASGSHERSIQVVLEISRSEDLHRLAPLVCLPPTMVVYSSSRDALQLRFRAFHIWLYVLFCATTIMQ